MRRGAACSVDDDDNDEEEAHSQASRVIPSMINGEIVKQHQHFTGRNLIDV